MITLGLVADVDADGIYVTLPGSRGVLRGPFETLQNVTAGDKVLIVTTDDGDCVVVGLAAAAVAGVSIPDGSITSAKIANGTIVDEDISASAAIAKTKIAGTAITAADTGTVTSAMIANGTIVNEDINSSAAIDRSKISGLPTTTTDNAVPRFDGTAGALQTSGVTIDDSGFLQAPGGIRANPATGDANLSADSPNASTNLYLRSVAGKWRSVLFTTNVAGDWEYRFAVGVTGDAESGSHAGSDFYISRWGDGWTNFGYPVKISRATGKITLGDVGSTAGLEFGSSGPRMMMGTGGPSGITAPVGSTWRQTDANTSHGSLTGLLWNKVGTGTTEGTDWLVDYEGRWATYTPTWTNVSMSATDARYTVTGKTCQLMLQGTLSAAPSGAVTVTVPSVASMPSYERIGPVRLIRDSTYNGVWLRASSSTLLIRYWNASGVAVNLSATLPAAWVSGDAIAVFATYEIA